ncbi:hypothetical protein PILCRDRAFT_87561 [Piloderma croceum F 1598]|uniref:Uncharacterized protein n=1 Tax=Piloderma croceum (strain F 1598) TaxID=765440 RepID=A0A0C3G2C5_PILCF|nr:hypothetical protein PILCRDRAFT_87561 [Piloderma croceum F 1598]
MEHRQANDDKALVEDRTGHIPLFLRPLFGLDCKLFHEVEDDYWMHHEIVGIGMNICSVTCGLAREAATAILCKGQSGRLFDKEWLSALCTFKNNGSVVRFMVEQVCLSIISEMGFHHEDLHWRSVPATIFKGDLIQSIHLGDQNTFFIPKGPYFKDIDVLFLWIHELSNTVLVAPFQITINKKHKDSEAAFYSGWAHWKAFLEGYEVQTCFMWIIEDNQSGEELEEESRMTRNGQQEVSLPHT